MDFSIFSIAMGLIYYSHQLYLKFIWILFRNEKFLEKKVEIKKHKHQEDNLVDLRNINTEDIVNKLNKEYEPFELIHYLQNTNFTVYDNYEK